MLLNWLDDDRETAGLKYEKIRIRLAKFFFTRGCAHSEELADESIDRVMGKAETLQKQYLGEPIRYFMGVAKYVFLEYTRRETSCDLPENLAFKRNSNPEQVEKLFFCLQKSLNNISSDQRRFILEYYSGTKSEKIERRKQISQKLNIRCRTIHVQAFRIRNKLQTIFFENLNQI